MLQTSSNKAAQYYSELIRCHIGGRRKGGGGGEEEEEEEQEQDEQEEQQEQEQEQEQEQDKQEHEQKQKQEQKQEQGDFYSVCSNNAFIIHRIRHVATNSNNREQPFNPIMVSCDGHFMMLV